MFFFKKLLAALALPPIGPVLLALLGLMILRRRPRLGRALILLGLILVLGLSLNPVANSLLHSLESHAPLASADLARAQAIVVLGGGKNYDAPEYGDDTVNRWTLERLRYGAFLQAQSGLPILVTGGAPSGGRPEGETMAEALERDFRARVTWVEKASLDTAENAALSAPMLKAAGITRVALVSQAWHLPRAAAQFRRQGLEILPAPTGFTTESPVTSYRWLPSAVALEKSSRALHEWLGILVQGGR